MTISRRNFIQNISVGLAGVTLTGKTYAKDVSLIQQESEKLLVKVPDQPEPAPQPVSKSARSASVLSAASCSVAAS